jgi:hypothetical protein
MIGHKAGYNETGSNKLYISNGDTASPLIHGDFSSGEVTINGNLTVNTLKDSSGNNMVRKVGNVVHIGVNSFTIEDASTSSSGKDEIASSINELQIGTSASHNTTVLGTLSVQTPTGDNHASTKAYVDTATNANTTNITTNTSDISGNATNITSNTSSISSNSVDITSNSNSISSIQTINTTQDTSISSNTTNITSNTNSISANSTSISTNASNIVTIESKNTSQDSSITSNSGNITNNTNSINTNKSSISDHANSIQTNQGLININIDKIIDIETGLAQSMAMSALVQPQYGKSNFSVATGNYNGTNAVAYGFSHHDADNDTTYRLLGSQSGNVSSSAVSVGWSF